MDELEQDATTGRGGDGETGRQGDGEEVPAADRAAAVEAAAGESEGDAAGIVGSTGTAPVGGAGAGTNPADEALRAELEAARAELAAARAHRVESHRRALLAENAGRVVPELVAGDTAEALDASLEVARAAYERVREATVAEVAASAHVGAGNGVRGTALDVEAMSPMQKIAHGLKPARE